MLFIDKPIVQASDCLVWWMIHLADGLIFVQVTALPTPCRRRRRSVTSCTSRCCTDVAPTSSPCQASNNAPVSASRAPSTKRVCYSNSFDSHSIDVSFHYFISAPCARRLGVWVQGAGIIIIRLSCLMIRFAVSDERVRMLHAGWYDAAIGAAEMRRWKRLDAEHLHSVVMPVPALLGRWGSHRYPAVSADAKGQTWPALRHCLSALNGAVAKGRLRFQNDPLLGVELFCCISYSCGL